MDPIDHVPELDDLASGWLDVRDLAHLPSLHNFHQMAVCAPDLVGIHLWTGDDQMFVRSGSRFLEYRSYPRLSLRIGGTEAAAESCRWFPYQALRRGTVDGWEVTTSARLVFESSGLLYEIRLRNLSGADRSLDVDLRTMGAAVDGTGAAVVWEDETQEVLVTAPVERPDRFAQQGRAVVAGWRPTIGAGAEHVLHLVQAEGPRTGEVLDRARRWAGRFSEVWSTTAGSWDERWRQVFTPDNGHFSGNAPVLETDHGPVARLYYSSLLTLLVLHRTDLRLSDRAFVTSGERARGDIFFWDTSMFSRVFALLEPEGLKQHLRLFLQVDPHGGAVFNMHTSRYRGGQYLQGYSKGHWYAANDMSLFRLAHDYVATSGDVAFLDEHVGSRTVRDHLEALATNWQALTPDADDGLADYGNIDNLLECVPTYVHRVASLNAANVWMMEAAAELHERSGDRSRARDLRGRAASLARRVTELYEPGEGVWACLDRDGTRQPVRHCYDFICTGKYLAPILDENTRHDMVGFVENELLTDRWMRAMSPVDPAAARSDRPDHGPYGAFDAWPAMAAETMLLLGFADQALDLLVRTVAAVREGPFGQAYELYGPDRNTPVAPVRIAQRGACLREGSGGGAFAETVLAGLFGFRPDLTGGNPVRGLDGPAGFNGCLHHLRIDGRLHRLSRTPEGLHLEAE